MKYACTNKHHYKVPYYLSALDVKRGLSGSEEKVVGHTGEQGAEEGIWP